jgi:PAS domain S-box-containing protein
MVTMANESEVRLQSIVETAVDGIITIDERGVVESFNPAAERMFGYTADEAIGQNISTLMPSPYRDVHDGYLANYLATGQKKILGVGREALARRKDGGTFPIHVSVGEANVGDRRIFTGILHDITGRKETEQRALQAERLAAIGQMVVSISHESRNALQLIQASSEVLALELKDDPDVHELIRRIGGAGERLERLFQELRDFAGPLTLERERHHVGHLLSEVLNDLALLHKDREINLYRDTNDCDPRCEIDSFRMAQVFRNVLENSLAACVDPVAIDVKCTNTQLDDRPALQLAIHDNGPGLSTDEKQKVFEPFFSTKSKGTGLGLAIAKRIVESHGGRMAVQCNGKPGAQFVITLPRNASIGT